MFLFSFSVGWEWKWRVIVSVVHLALQPSENEHSAACGNNNSHVASASLCLKEDGSYFSKLRLVSVEKDGTQLGLKWSALYCHWNDTELSNSTPWHCTWFFFFFFQSICSKICHVWPTLIFFVALEILPYYSPLQTAVLLEIANPSRGERCQRDARVCLI